MIYENLTIRDGYLVVESRYVTDTKTGAYEVIITQSVRVSDLEQKPGGVGMFRVYRESEEN